MAPPVTEWDSQGKPIQSPAGSSEWDVTGKPIVQSSRPAGLPPDMGWPAHPAVTMHAPSGSNLVPAALSVGEGLKGVAKGALHTLDSTDDFARAHLPAVMTNTNMGFGPPANLEAEHAREVPHGTAQKIGYGGEQVGEFLLPTGIEEGAAKLGGAALGHGGEIAGKLLGSGLHSGAINKVQGGNFATGALMGAGGSAIGEGLRAAAPALAETALRVRGNDRLFGRTVGDAILNDTKGVYPSTVARTAQETINSIKPELEQRAAQAGASGVRGSLLPARQGVADTIGNHLTNRAVESAGDLEPLASRLAVDPVTHLPLAADQSPTGLLNLKRGINSDFIQNWRPDQPPGLKSSARGAYGAINDEFHNAVPGAQELDQRVSSLIPVTKRAAAADANAGLLQRTAGRLMAHTGAATLGGLGAAGGYKEGGVPGAIAGGLTGIVAPEMISSPTAQMIMARGFHSAVPNLLIPAARGAVLQLDRPKDNQ